MKSSCSLLNISIHWDEFQNFVLNLSLQIFVDIVLQRDHNGHVISKYILAFPIHITLKHLENQRKGFSKLLNLVLLLSFASTMFLFTESAALYPWLFYRDGRLNSARVTSMNHCGNKTSQQSIILFELLLSLKSN